MPPRKKIRHGRSRTWQDVAQEARQHRDKSLLLASKICKQPFISIGEVGTGTQCVIAIPGKRLESEFSRLTAMNVSKLVQEVAAGSISSSAITKAFLGRALIAHEFTNCVTELLVDRCLARAKELDDFRARTGKTRGPLHGLPISIKSHIGIKGCHTPAAYVAWWDKLAPQDALLVEILERAGAIVHARTTEPQTMMQLECNSNLYGATANPYNTRLSSGGSSGGEAALVAMGGSVIGVGSDVAGSIRVPAAACGLFGLKPTNFRIPTRGWGSIPPGADHIPPVLGPLCGSLDGIHMFMDAVLSTEPWVHEPALVPLPWRKEQIVPTVTRPLRIGIMPHDGLVRPHPPISRAIEELSAKLKGLPNIEVTDISPYKTDEALAIAFSLYFSDGGEADKKVMAEAGEPMCPLVEFLFKEIPGIKKLSRQELEYWLEEREEYRLEFSEHWNKTGTWIDEEGRWNGAINALICPVGPGVANRHNTSKYFAYTSVWNLLDYPALAFPVGSVDATKDTKSMRLSFMSGHDQENWDLYDPQIFDGMPIGLQIVGRRFDDEKIVAILGYLMQHGVIG